MSEQSKESQRAAIRRLLMYWGNVQRARRDHQEAISRAEQEIESLYDLRAGKSDGMPGANAPGDPTGENVARNEAKIHGMEKHIAFLRRELDNMNYKAALIEEEIMCLPPLENEVVRLRYGRYGVSTKGYWPKIAKRVQISQDWAKALERQAVDRLLKRILVK